MLGFGHEAEAINLGSESVLFQSFNRLFGSVGAPGPWDALTRLFPILGLIVSVFKLYGDCNHNEMIPFSPVTRLVLEPRNLHMR